MKIRIFVFMALLAQNFSIVSMDHDELIPLDRTKFDSPLKKKIASRLTGVSDEVSKKVLDLIIVNTHLRDDAINWCAVASGLKQFEKSLSLSRGQAAIEAGLAMVNTVWLVYPTVMRMSSSENEVCFVDSMNPVEPVVELLNCFACISSLYVLMQATGPKGGCPTSKKLALKLRQQIKNKASGGAVQSTDLDSILLNNPKRGELYTKAAGFALNSDGKIDVATFKKFLPRSYAMPDILRYFMAFAFITNVFPSLFCAPGVWTTDDSGANVGPKGVLALLGVGLYMLNAAEGFILLAGPKTSNKKLTDTRIMYNTIQDHFEKKSLADMV